MSLFRLRCLGEVPSTNAVVKRALERGEREGLAVSADRQSSGYGRQGRSWESPEGGMYLSVLLRPSVPADQLPTLSLVAAVVVRQALASLLPAAVAEAIKVKWPNDICLVGGDAAGVQASPAAFCKLVGISLEQHAGGVCVGIGANVAPPAQGALEVGGKNRPAYLEQFGLDGTRGRAGAVAQVREAVLGELEVAYGTWLAEGFAPFMAPYERHGALKGHDVVVEDRQGAVLASGRVAGIDGQGRLLVAVPGADRPTAVASGEAHLRSLG